ncbi:DNA primase [Nocardioides luteus]|uniref:DNA primase n=1 Tax=Nocardioides luteus TaxID=1844 RepID=A0A1J4N1F5_9ACTN|nr:DNA primase [Nocardioides luteus]OIJ25404.1 DNA primase [Nocardioides luteus]
MAGRIKETSIQEVREKARLDDIVSQYVTLRRAGPGTYKGLCPFHDEKSPSFNVNPSRGFYKCFGCGEGGDVIDFVMKLDGLSFFEAVERLGDKVGVQVQREEGDEAPVRRGPGRGKLVEAHKVAAEFYAEQLLTPDAVVARQFLAEKGFDRDAALHFGVGFSPRGGEDLYRHLRARGFSDEEVVTAGLVAQGRSHYDRFRGRLMWPIRESGGDVIGFGARRLFDDDRIEAKYLNTSETPIYKKSHVLYGIDLARKEMARTREAVIVEGYTDVMACHLAGVTTAVATCGTAFGDDHAKVLRRFISDDQQLRGAVVFTFDGDAAGQAAALKAFKGDGNFTSQTYVAVEPDGLDPNDLRIKKGDEAVRELLANRVPLYEFVLRNVASKYDLDRADGRIDALREAAPLVASVRDESKKMGFTRDLARFLGVDPDEAAREVRRAAGRPAPSAAPSRREPVVSPEVPAAPRRPPMPHPREPRFAVERETLKLFVQHPVALGRTTGEITPEAFTHPLYRALWETIAGLGGPGAGTGDPAWAQKLSAAASDPLVSRILAELAVEPIPSAKEPDSAYVLQYVVRLLELLDQRRIADVKSRLQRADAGADPEGYNRLFAQLAALEQHRRGLRNLVAE